MKRIVVDMRQGPSKIYEGEPKELKAIVEEGNLTVLEGAIILGTRTVYAAGVWASYTETNEKEQL